MFDKTILDDVIKYYKRDFEEFNWEREEFKWKAVKIFQDNWDINAVNFSEMLTLSLSGTSNLLNTKQFFPMGMITEFAETAPEEVRSMFKALFDESRDVVERILEFKNSSTELLAKYRKDAKNHYQTENSISTYLWLKYPDKYYIYKYDEVKAVAKELGSDYVIKKGYYESNLKNFYNLYDEICNYIKTDSELTNLLQSHLTESHYKDTEFKTLTVDICFYISRYYPERKGWFPLDYSPEITVDTWVMLLQNPDVFNTDSLKAMKRYKDYGGQATCKQLSEKYGNVPFYYNSISTNLAKRVKKVTDCPLYKDGKEDYSKWWPVLYVGKSSPDKNVGTYIWKLRQELSDALDKVDLSAIQLYEDKEKAVKVETSGSTAEAKPTDIRYWWLNANPKIWSLGSAKVGEEQSYTLYNENKNRRRIFQNFLDVKPGDKVIGYESNPAKQIVAICEITAASDGEKIKFKKIESLSSPVAYSDLRDLPELKEMEFFVNPNGSLFKLTADEYDVIMDIVRETNPPLPDEISTENSYKKTDFLSEVYISEDKYAAIVSVLKNKKNIILQGAPGVGKTFAAKRLAYSVMGIKDGSRVKLIQFHQNYSYEDFIMGYKPSGDGYELKNGIFYQFCITAASQPDKDFFFIIDEINRGNMSKIFGELLMMIESDHRGEEITLAYNGLRFSVPENLYIIGMMNTADRSIAMIDYALRRRFSFIEMEPCFDSDGFTEYQQKINNPIFDRLIDKIKQLNKEISDDKTLGKGFCIGHSYFCNWQECTISKMREVVEFDIIPTLNEYWFDDAEKCRRWTNELRGVLNDAQ